MYGYKIQKDIDDKRPLKEFIESLSTEDRKQWDDDVKRDFMDSMEFFIHRIETDIEYLKKGISPVSDVSHFYKVFYRIEEKAQLLQKDYTNYRYMLGLVDKPYKIIKK